jgi:multidrug transporter EmrE-like cation transporter
MYIIIVLLIAAILTEAITEIVTKSEIFEPFRAKIFKLGQSNKFFTWLHSLLDCGYCFSVWSGVLVAILFFRGTHLLHWSIDWFFVAIVLHRLSNLFHNIMDRIHERFTV